MLAYVKLAAECRSVFIGKYFGDDKMKKCGSCDNCLQQKNATLNDEEFFKIKDAICSHLNNGGVQIKQLLQQLPGIKKEKIWKVLDYLQAERKVTVNDEGLVMKN
jgi:ATP-dependent DNA helicase RecQ